MKRMEMYGKPFEENFGWSNGFIPEMKRIIGPHLLEPASIQQDREEATDLIILNARDKRIACRVRRAKYWPDFRGQFTLRSKGKSGGPSELTKVIDGEGDWMFYGFARADDATEFVEWYLIDLPKFRSGMLRKLWCKVFSDSNARLPCDYPPMVNWDGTEFFAFNVNQFPDDLLVASHIPDETMKLPFVEEYASQ